MNPVNFGTSKVGLRIKAAKTCLIKTVPPLSAAFHVTSQEIHLALKERLLTKVR